MEYEIKVRVCQRVLQTTWWHRQHHSKFTIAKL